MSELFLPSKIDCIKKMLVFLLDHFHLHSTFLAQLFQRKTSRYCNSHGVGGDGVVVVQKL